MARQATPLRQIVSEIVVLSFGNEKGKIRTRLETRPIGLRCFDLNCLFK